MSEEECNISPILAQVYRVLQQIGSSRPTWMQTSLQLILASVAATELAVKERAAQ